MAAKPNRIAANGGVQPVRKAEERGESEVECGALAGAWFISGPIVTHGGHKGTRKTCEGPSIPCKILGMQPNEMPPPSGNPAQAQPKPPQGTPPGKKPGKRPDSLRRRVHFILEVDRFGDRLSRFVDKGLVALIVANVLVAVIQTVDSIYVAAPWFFESFENASILVFGLEYVLRVWSCREDPTVQSRLGFMLQPMMLLDLAVLVLPVYFDLRPLRILRLLRLGRYSPRLRLFADVLRTKREELLMGVFIAVVLLVAASTAMYHVEGKVNDSFKSIPETMWWGVATLTTVGYGDVYPVTSLGKALGAVVALLGVGVFALPAGILAGGFSDALEAQAGVSGPQETRSGALGDHGGKNVPTGEQESQTRGTCPHCGSSL